MTVDDVRTMQRLAGHCALGNTIGVEPYMHIHMAAMRLIQRKLQRVVRQLSGPFSLPASVFCEVIAVLSEVLLLSAEQAVETIITITNIIAAIEIFLLLRIIIDYHSS